MIRTRKRSREQADMDRLSSMPDDILLHILKFLHVKEIGRTSILSQRWRDVWTSMPGINLDFERLNCKPLCWMLHPIIKIYDSWEFLEDVERQSHRPLYRLRKILLQRFHEFDRMFKLQVLFSLAARHGIKELYVRGRISMLNRKSIIFPKRLCDVLEELVLKFDCILKLNASTPFIKLKKLFLFGITISNTHTSRMLFSCRSSVLESLHFEFCTFNGMRVLYVSSLNLRDVSFINIEVNGYSNRVFRGKLRIHAPNLTSLNYLGVPLKSYEYYSLPSTCNATMLILVKPAIPHDYVFHTISIDLLPEVILQYFCPSFRKHLTSNDSILLMKWLKLQVRSTSFYVEGVVELVKVLSNLEILEIDFTEDFDDRGDWKPEENNTPFLPSRLKIIKIYNLTSSSFLMELAKYFLAHSTLLEMMLIFVKTPEIRTEILGKLSSFPRASQGATLIVQNSIVEDLGSCSTVEKGFIESGNQLSSSAKWLELT